MDMRKSKETCLSESGAFFQQMLSPLQEGPETSAMTTFTANTYVIDTSNGTEIARLIDQSQILARYLGGVFPEPAEELPPLHNILDLACGPGCWVLNVAYAYPKVSVLGVDIDASLVRYARARARTQGLKNAMFQIMDITRPLNFPENTFDLINAQFLFGVLQQSVWSPLIAECLRILRPGGVLRVTEGENPLTNSLAGEELSAIFSLALHKSGRGFSPDGRNIGMTPMLGWLLRTAGFISIEKVAYPLDFSTGTLEHTAMRENCLVAVQLIKPFLMDMEVISERDFNQLFHQFSIDLLSETFCGLWVIQSSWGRKPM